MQHDLAWLVERPIAHRGLHDPERGIIENGPSAICAAIEASYNIEVDVRLTADGEVAVFHDAQLDRLTHGSGPIDAQRMEDLRRIPWRDTADKMLSLDELLALVSDRAGLCIELKSGPESRHKLARAAAAQLGGYVGRVAVMSFDPLIIRALSTILPSVARGLVATPWLDDQPWPVNWAQGHLLHLPISRAQFVAYDIGALPAFAPWWARRVLRMPVLTWTVRSAADRECAARYADAMIFEGFRP